MRWGFVAAAFFAGAAHGAHPLNTEDTGTQGKRRWQLELNGERNRDQGVDGAAAAAVLSYGIAETVDLQAGLPWQDLGTEKGVGDAFAALKWRFWEEGPVSFGLRAGVFLPTGNEQRGLGAGHANAGALLIASYEGERWIFLAHAGYRGNRNAAGDRESLSELSGAVLYKVTERLKLALDAVRGTNPDPGSSQALRSTVLGVIWQVHKDIDLDAGVRRGNDAAIDRAFMAGVTWRW